MTITTLPLDAHQLSDGQRAAVAKLLYVTERPGTLAALCGPDGTGKSSVLDALARAGEAAGRKSFVISALEIGESPLDGPVDVLLVDDAERASHSRLADLVARCRKFGKQASIVLAGTGRLLTLMAREPHVERMVQLRAILTTFSRAETHCLVSLIAGDSLPSDEGAALAVSDTIHEVAGGIPAAVVRLSELASVVAGARPGTPLTPHDVELVHRRLAVSAA